MLYIIGIGLNIEDLNIKAIKILKEVDEIFIDTYTSCFPFKIEEYKNFLKKILKKVKISEASRELLEEASSKFLKNAVKKKVALLVYGDPLIATTHISLINEAKKLKVRTKVIHNISILNVITDSGLSAYKFGKIASMPRWQENYKPTSFYEVIKQNLSIDAHTLLLIDSTLSFEEAIKQLIEVDKDLLLKEIFVCSNLGTEKSQIKKINLKEKRAKIRVGKPFCFVIPSKISFYEKI
ncbi:MAG: diphthine synthase [Candidatus Pacearchaeota archaeon]